jgi:hypothetical protein
MRSILGSGLVIDVIASALCEAISSLKWGIAHLHCNKRSAAQVSGDDQERPRNDMGAI